MAITKRVKVKSERQCSANCGNLIEIGTVAIKHRIKGNGKVEYYHRECWGIEPKKVKNPNILSRLLGGE